MPVSEGNLPGILHGKGQTPTLKLHKKGQFYDNFRRVNGKGTSKKARNGRAFPTFDMLSKLQYALGNR